jgi:hemolysin activation/secretion protein
MLRKLSPFVFCFIALQSAFAAGDTVIQGAASPKVVNQKSAIVEGIAIVEGGIQLKDVAKEHGISVSLGGKDDRELEMLLKPFLNSLFDDSFLRKVKKTIVDYFLNEKNQHVFVMVPVQQIEHGILVLQVIEGNIGALEFKGQKWFSPGVIQRALGVKEGDPLIEDVLLNDLVWANKNPYRSSQMLLSQSDEKGITNITFITKDRFPARFYIGSDNTGYQSNGEVRVFGGGTWANAFMMGDILSYQYTASPNFHAFQSHLLNYTVFLPWKHALTVFGCYGQVFPTIPFYTTSGISVQGSARYQIPIYPLYGDFRSQLETGFDYKLLNSNSFFAGDAFQEPSSSGGFITVTQFLASYALQKNWVSSVLKIRTDCYFSPWRDWLPHQKISDYAVLRPGSHVRYGYWKTNIIYQYQTKNKWCFSNQFRGQVASGTLPTSEQFGLGGVDTVRGYFEQQFVADNAICMNSEIYTPPFPVFEGFDNQMSFLTFADYGYGYNYTAISPEFIKQNLLGIGLGFRFDIETYMHMKADYGFQVLGIPFDHRFGRFHLSLILGY